MADPNTDAHANEVPEMPMDQALGINSGSNQTTSVTDVAPRAIDMRSGNLVVNSPAGKISELGVQPDKTYAHKILNPSTGAAVAQFGGQADGTANLRFFDANGIGLAQFGKFPDGSTALKVAKPGIEVSTATNDQLVFNSSQDIFKVVKTDSFTIPAASITQTGTNQWNSGQNSVAKAHGLGFTPIVLGFSLDGSSHYTPLSYTFHGVGSFNNPSWETAQISADATNVYGTTDFTMFSGTLAGTFGFTSNTYNVKYYLLQETAN